MAKNFTTKSGLPETHLTSAEINKIIDGSKSGLRYTVDLYLLDYLKHCLLEEGQLEANIGKLQAALDHISDAGVKQGIEDVIDNLTCVQKEYIEYVNDMRTLINGGVPEPR